MKCTKCSLPLDALGMVLTYVSGTATYTATLHFHCLEDTVGIGNSRKIRRLALDSGWTQSGFPDLRDRG